MIRSIKHFVNTLIIFAGKTQMVKCKNCNIKLWKNTLPVNKVFISYTSVQHNCLISSKKSNNNFKSYQKKM